MIKKKIRQMLCAILSLAMFVSMINITPYVAKAATDEVTESTSTNSYGLRDNVGEGVILNIVELNNNKEIFSLIDVNEE